MKLNFLALALPLVLIIGGETFSQAKDHKHMGNSMGLGNADAKLDLRFIDGMVLHHQGAVTMAKEALQKSKRPEIKKLATEIIKTQTAEIKQLQTWRNSWYPKAEVTPVAWDSQMGHTMSMSDSQKITMTMAVNLGKPDANFDLRFIDAMVPHHEGALMMAKEVQQKTKRSEIAKLAQNILSSQQTEIQQMQQWKKSWYE